MRLHTMQERISGKYCVAKYFLPASSARMSFDTWVRMHMRKETASPFTHPKLGELKDFC